MSSHQYEYKKAMDSIHVTEEWEDEMIRRLLTGKTKKNKSRRAARIGFAVAAAAACLTIGAGAAEAAAGAVSEFFAPLFGSTHTEIIDSIGYPVGVSDTDNGVTVTADAIVGDKNNVCVIFTLKKDDGSAWDLAPDSTYLNFEESKLDFHMLGGMHGSSWFIDEDPSDNILQYVEQRTGDEGITSTRATATLKNLRVWDDQAQESRVVVKGKWTLRFDLDFEDASRQFPCGQTVEFLGEPAVIKDITFSPIAFRVELEQNRTEYPLTDDYKYLDGPSEALDQLEVILTLTDGTEMDIGYWSGGSFTPGDGKSTFVKSSIFDEVIPLEEMESVTICGTVISLR